MASWPGSPSFTNANVDDPSDNPSLARADIASAMTDLSNVIDSRGQADGVAPLDGSSKVPLANIPLVPVANGMTSYQVSGSYSWTVPAGVTKVYVEVWGAGGGGGYGLTSKHGGGGGAGGGSYKIFAVTPGDVATIFVGLGGSGGISPGGNGATGGNTTLTLNGYTVTGQGGEGGYGSDPPVGGVGGPGYAGDVHIEGGTGLTGVVGLGGSGGTNARAGAAPGNGPTFGGAGFGGGGYGSGTGGPNPAVGGKDGGVFLMW